MSKENEDGWKPIVTEEMEDNAELAQDKFDELTDRSSFGPWDPYTLTLDEFNYRMQEIEDLGSVSELIRELIPYITTTAAVIESMSTTILIFHLAKEDKIYDDGVYNLFDNELTQGQRGRLLDELNLLPTQLSDDMIKFNKLRNVIVHEQQSHYSLNESRFDENEFGDALLAGVRSVQGLHDLMDMEVPDAAFQ
jgi:hypothetical protein